MVGGRRRPREVDMVSVRVAPGGGGARAGSAVAERGLRRGPAGGRAGSPCAVGLPEPGRPVPSSAAAAARSGALSGRAALRWLPGSCR